jgi:hypothetical protein
MSKFDAFRENVSAPNPRLHLAKIKRRRAHGTQQELKLFISTQHETAQTTSQRFIVGGSLFHNTE